MNFDKVTQAMDECERRIRADLGTTRLYVTTADMQRTGHLTHCLDMIRRFREFGPERIEKTFRWLGFIQGVMYAHGLADVETLKNMNRPDRQDAEGSDE